MTPPTLALLWALRALAWVEAGHGRRTRRWHTNHPAPPGHATSTGWTTRRGLS